MSRHRVGLLLALLCVPGAARASGPVEQPVQVAFHPQDPDIIVLRYENKGGGLLFSDDGGASWRLVCGAQPVAALSADIEPFARTFRPQSMTLTASGRVLLGSSSFLWEDDGHGCDWTTVPLLDQAWVTDLVIDPGEQGAAFAVTGSPTLAENGIWRRDPDGAWSTFGSPSDRKLTRLRVVETSDGRRFYASAYVTDEAGLTHHLLRVSDDEAQTFREHPFADGTLRLAAVDPRDPDRIVAVLDRPAEPDDLLVSSDQGETFSLYLTVEQFSGIALANDGRLLIGEAPRADAPSSASGLWFAASLDAQPAKIGDEPVYCVAYQETADAFFACQLKQFGRVSTDDGAFTPSFDLREVIGFVECDGADAAATCKDQLCRAYCGYGHFASAPVCSAYDEPTCGPCAAVQPGAGGAECGAMAGASGSAGGSGGDGGAGGDGGDGGADTDAGSTPRAQGGGCTTLVPRAVALGSPRAWAPWACALLLGCARARRVGARGQGRSRYCR